MGARVIRQLKSQRGLTGIVGDRANRKNLFTRSCPWWRFDQNFLLLSHQFDYLIGGDARASPFLT